MTRVGARSDGRRWLFAVVIGSEIRKEPALGHFESCDGGNVICDVNREL